MLADKHDIETLCVIVAIAEGLFEDERQHSADRKPVGPKAHRLAAITRGLHAQIRALGGTPEEACQDIVAPVISLERALDEAFDDPKLSFASRAAIETARSICRS